MARAIPGGYKLQPYNSTGITVLKVRSTQFFGFATTFWVTFNRQLSFGENLPAVWWVDNPRSTLVQGSSKFGIPLTHTRWSYDFDGNRGLAFGGANAEYSTGDVATSYILAHPTFLVVARLNSSSPVIPVSPLMHGMPPPR